MAYISKERLPVAPLLTDADERSAGYLILTMRPLGHCILVLRWMSDVVQPRWSRMKF